MVTEGRIKAARVSLAWQAVIAALQEAAIAFAQLGQTRDADQMGAYSQTFTQHAQRSVGLLGAPGVNGFDLRLSGYVGQIAVHGVLAVQAAVADDADGDGRHDNPGHAAARRLGQVHAAIRQGDLSQEAERDFANASRLLIDALRLTAEAERQLLAADDVLMRMSA